MIDDALQTRFTTPAGEEVRLDLVKLQAWAKKQGAVCVMLPVIKEECTSRIVAAVSNRYGDRLDAYRLGRATTLAQQRLDAVIKAFDRADPSWTNDDIVQARELFAANQRDLSKLIRGMPKDPVPDPHDLRILVQARKLGAGTAHVFSNDVHFWGYADLCKKWWNLEIHKASLIPLLLEQWGG